MEKWLWCLFVFQILYKMVRGQWLLTIRMLQFQNLYNVEVRPGQANPICCCDQAFCQPSFDTLTESCPPWCDTYFLVSMNSPCQGSDQCHVFLETDPIGNSAATTNTSYEFPFVLNTYPTQPVEVDIAMRDSDGSSNREIDTFTIQVPFSSGNQSEIFRGNRGIANITLSYDITCADPTCKPVNSSLQCKENVTMTNTHAGASVSSFTTTVTATSTSITIITSVTTVTTTHTDTIVATNNQVVNSTSTTTVVQSLTKTVMVGECATIKATPPGMTQTLPIPFASCSPEQLLDEQALDSSFESTALVWMSLFILFFLFTIAALTISIALACVLRKKTKSNSVLRPEYPLAVQENSRAVTDSSVHGTIQTSLDSDKVHSDANSQDFYCTLTSVARAKADSNFEHDYSKCGPAHSPSRRTLTELTRTGDSEPRPYETPQSLFKSK